MQRRLLIFFCLTAFLGLFAFMPKPRVLVYSKTGGYRHSSIGVGKLAIMTLGKENGFDVDTSEDSTVFHR